MFLMSSHLEVDPHSTVPHVFYHLRIVFFYLQVAEDKREGLGSGCRIYFDI